MRDTDLDTLKHTNLNYPENILGEPEFPATLKEKIFRVLDVYKKIILCSDHGTSRLAVLARQTKFDNAFPAGGRQVYKSGRFADALAGDEKIFPIAKMFYDMNKKTHGLVAHYDYIALDEIQSINFNDVLEMRGALKGYLESGDYRVVDMFSDLPEIFQDSALLDRFRGFIKGWMIPKMNENLKANSWALNTEYFGEISHSLRDELCYRAVVDQILDVPKNVATRDIETIKRICTGFLKLLFPHIES